MTYLIQLIEHAPVEIGRRISSWLIDDWLAQVSTILSLPLSYLGSSPCSQQCILLQTLELCCFFVSLSIFLFLISRYLSLFLDWLTGIPPSLIQPHLLLVPVF